MEATIEQRVGVSISFLRTELTESGDVKCCQSQACEGSRVHRIDRREADRSDTDSAHCEIAIARWRVDVSYSDSGIGRTGNLPFGDGKGEQGCQKAN